MNTDLINNIWRKATRCDGFNPDIVRKDCCGAWIVKSEFGNRDSAFGWEIDHAYPKAKGGDDNIINLRPMHWENNQAKSDDFPVYNIAVRSEGNKNVHTNGQFKMNDALLQQLSKLYHF